MQALCVQCSGKTHFTDETVAQEAEPLAPAAWLWLGSGVCERLAGFSGVSGRSPVTALFQLMMPRCDLKGLRFPELSSPKGQLGILNSEAQSLRILCGPGDPGLPGWEPTLTSDVL